jgi:hypothetical protein
LRRSNHPVTLRSVIPPVNLHPQFFLICGNYDSVVYGWALTDAHAFVGLFSTTQNTSILPRHTSGSAFYRINDGSTASGGIATASPVGFYSAIRTGASAQKGYKNAVDQNVVSVTSGAQLNGTIYILGAHGIGTGSDGGGGTLAIYASGAALSPTQVSGFCTASNVVLNAISGLALGTC